MLSFPSAALVAPAVTHKLIFRRGHTITVYPRVCGGTDEAHAFSPAAELVAGWQRFRFGAAETRGRVEPAMAKERRWELEIAMLSEFGLTLPPEAEPLEESIRDDHLEWRRRVLGKARRDPVRVERLLIVLRVLTLGLWWK